MKKSSSVPAGSPSPTAPASSSMHYSSSLGDQTAVYSSMVNLAPKGFMFQKRACARCHRLKMKCVFEDTLAEACKRCMKSGLECSMTEDHTIKRPNLRPKKKVRKLEKLNKLKNSLASSYRLLESIKSDETFKINSNIIDLDLIQKEINELQTNFQALRTASKIESEQAYTGNSMKDGPVAPLASIPSISIERNLVKELLQMGILSLDNAKEKLSSFINDFYPCWPCISFPPHYTFDWLIENEPILLLSCITVTCLNEPNLHDILLFYLEQFLAVKTSGRKEISITYIQVYLILSLWCAPPKKWGTYKHQMDLMMALNLTLCLDLGNEVHIDTTKALYDASIERQVIRNFMCVYMSCGSLGLSVPRFKVVKWTPTHEKYSQALLVGETNASDRFLYYSSKLIALGEDIINNLCPNGVISPLCVEKEVDVLKDSMIAYERRMQLLAMESGLFNHYSKIGSLLSIIYYQLLMTMYDYVVCNELISQQQGLSETYLQILNRLIKASEKVIDSFVQLSSLTDKCPTFFYYRPMHALVSLIRVRLLVKAQKLDFEVGVEAEFLRVSNALDSLTMTSKVALKMKVILTRVHSWMTASKSFSKKGATNSMVDLLRELGNDVNLANKTDNTAVMKPTDAVRALNVNTPLNFVPSPIGYSETDVIEPIDESLFTSQIEDESIQNINGLLNKIEFEFMGVSNLNDWPI